MSDADLFSLESEERNSCCRLSDALEHLAFSASGSLNSFTMIVYSGPLDDTHTLIQFFRREAPKLRILRRLIVSREKTVVLDVNRDGIEFPGLTFESPALPKLLEDLGVVYSRESLNEVKGPDGIKEFSLGAVWCWGHDNVS